MDPMQASSSVPEPDEKSPRPWARALLSGTVFGGLGAAAMHWIGFHSHAPAQRASTTLSRKWITAIAGAASGSIAMYGTLRADDAPPRSVFPEPGDRPDTHILAESVHRERMIPSPGERSL